MTSPENQNMPSARANGILVEYNQNKNSYLLIGGSDRNQGYNDAWLLLINEKKWEKLNIPQLNEKFSARSGVAYSLIENNNNSLILYIHGGQEKIAAIFDDARANAPSILFFDEIDAMIKDRSKHTNVSEAGEVNEFLAQLNNCGQDGVIVIGATNKPNEIDEAALRAGRLELKYYIPQPDVETRKSLFRLNLKNRKTDFGINYDRLAELTENYVSADIRLIVDTAARLVFRRREEKITMAILEEAISQTKPSLTPEMIKRHEAIRDRFEGNEPVVPERKRIGF